MAAEIEHKDVLGNPITLSSKLAVARHNTLVVCSIVKIHPKMMRVKPINAGQYYRGDGYLAYPDNCIVVDGPDVMAYILKGPQ
jgi:hypothetical protein